MKIGRNSKESEKEKQAKGSIVEVSAGDEAYIKVMGKSIPRAARRPLLTPSHSPDDRLEYFHGGRNGNGIRDHN